MKVVGVIALVIAEVSAVCRESKACEGSANMCDCRGFSASAYQPAMEVYASESEKSIDGYKEGTCGYANAACDLKWAILCCDSGEEVPSEPSEFQPIEELSGGAGLVEDVESPEEFCGRHGLKASKFSPERVAYPGGGFVGVTGHQDGTCGNVVAMGMTQFAICCCESREFCCPRGVEAEDCLSRAVSRDLEELNVVLGSYSYSFAEPYEEDVVVACVDSVDWYKTNDTSVPGVSLENIKLWVMLLFRSKDCAWVSSFPSARCDTKGADRSFASYSCPDSCNTTCNDSSDWYKTNDTSKNCAWVSVFPEARCDVKGWDGTIGSYSCPDACGLQVTVSDSEDWYKNGEPSKDCAWVSQYASARCEVKGWDGSFAADSCPFACSALLVADDTL
ncbi:hypothetical protein CTAYLR_009627 [Chrysophaeum taylorii]|uniref:Uncharacterized protein n=1 Tax=Chrysophaeum taylorii TaxID=2483200 RepID=A0AAD7UIE6_9STRA|nr:hypothetical protein CTAYLR_009627 [Chrysophaeum taylorii]